MSQNAGPLEYLKLIRLQTGATTALAPVIGYLVLAAQTDYTIIFSEILLLFLIGILMHIFVFVLNEYIDVDVDRLSPDLAGKPLVKGTISTSAALGLAFAAMIIAYILAFFFFYNPWAIIMLTLAFEFGAIYDIFGKRFPGSDFTLALWIFFFCIFGASVVSQRYTGILYLVAGLGFFQILFNNTVEGGIKDSDHDATAGAHTLANALGVRVKNRKLIIPISFKVASFAIKFGYISIIVILIYFSIIKFRGIFDYFHFILIVLLLIIILTTLHKFLSLTTFRRDKLKRIFSIHEISTFYLSAIILLQLIGLAPVLGLLILPLGWYIILNLVLYGRPLEPRV